jgi:predicted  nucleic acid-binding Zn-ribbon protein
MDPDLWRRVQAGKEEVIALLKQELKDQAEIAKNQIDALIKERTDDLANKKKELEEIYSESQEEEKKLLSDREKAAKKIEDKFLKYYERLRINLSNGLAVVRVVRGAAEGCNKLLFLWTNGKSTSQESTRLDDKNEG